MSVEERVARLEADSEFLKQAFQRIDDIPGKTVDRLQERISAAVADGVRLHRRGCKARKTLRALQESRNTSQPPQSQPPQPPAAPVPIDWAAWQKLIAGLIVTGSLVGGFFWGSGQPDAAKRPQLVDKSQHTSQQAQP